jgi:TetR/AcrR family transcriptional repressor of mexJK operon
MTPDTGEPPTQGSSGAEETRQRIIRAAAQTFADLGYARATTRVIAAAADVTEVTLFRHFGSKQNLFQAVLDSYSALPELTTRLEEQFTGDYHQDMLNLGRHFMGIMLQRRDAVRMMLCEADHFPEVRQALAQFPRRLRHMLADYLRGQIERGQVRDLHPELMAHAFWGMFFSHGLSEGLLDEPAAPDVPVEEIVAQFVDIFVSGTARTGV